MRDIFGCQNGALDAEIDSLDVVALVRNGEYSKVLTHDLVQEIFNFRKLSSSEEWAGALQNNITAYVDDVPGTRLQRQVSVLCIAVSSLQLFAQLNWVGPPVDWDNSKLLPQLDMHPSGLGKDYFLKLLSVDGETVYSLIDNPELLALAQLILQDCWDSLTLCQESRLWCLRCLKLHQELLEDRSPTLKKQIMDLIGEVCDKESHLISEDNKDLAVLTHLEVAHLLYFYYEPSLAESHVTEAVRLSGLTVQLTGALGKRTRFQQKEVSQLLLLVSREDTAPNPNTDVEKLPDTSLLPKNLNMDDDTVLESVQFTTHEQNTAVTDVEQSLILGLLYHHRKTHEGIGDILKEESLAYINFVLGEPQCWSIQTSALLMRTSWECDSTRRLQRSLTQLEELVNQYQRAEPPGVQRLHLLHSAQLPPKWLIQRQLAQLLMKIGSTNGALEVFLQIHMWEDVIKCYASLGRTEKAETVIREQLSISETPLLYCYLGDVTNDPQYYEKAWSLSKSRSARAQKSLGYYYLRKSEFETCLPHFEKSLAINSLQIGVWFSYGCAGLASKNYPLATKAFHRCVTLEATNFEAWNNLATAYVRTNQKSRAFVAFQEAIKCNYDNWRLWENFMVVGADVGEFSEVIRAYHRLLDLKDKYADTQVLEVLVKAVNRDLLDAKSRPCSELRTKLQELFGRITSKVTNNAVVWKLYAELVLGQTEVTQEKRVMALQYLQKCHRCDTQTLSWEKDVEKCKHVSEQCQGILTVYLTLCESMTETTQIIQHLSSAKLMLRGVLAKIKTAHTNPATDEIQEDLDSLCQQLQSQLEQVEGLITEKKGS